MTYGWFDSSLIGTIFDMMENMGIFDYILPWLLYYAIIYGLLTRIDLFGKSNQGQQNQSDKIGDKVNRIIALSIATLILYYVPQSKIISEMLAELFTKWGLLAVTLLLIPLTLGIFGFNDWGSLLKKQAKNNETTLTTLGWIILGVVAVVIFLFLYGTIGRQFKEYLWIIDPYNIAIAITIVILGFIIASVTGVLSSEE